MELLSQPSLTALRDILQPGLTLANRAGDQWAILLSDASEPGRFRYQIFDAKGFISHHCTDTLDKALEEAFECGYIHVDDGALDRVSGEPEWAKGMAIQAIRDQYNTGLISWKEMFARFKKVS